MRMRLRGGQTFLVTLLVALHAGGASAVDMTGVWDVHWVATSPSLPASTDNQWIVSQSGTALAIDSTAPSPPYFFGEFGVLASIDPDSGEFSYVGEPGGEFGCPGIMINGSVDPGGTSFTGSVTVYLFFPHGPPCAPQTSTVSGTLTPCGDGVLDAGEACDDGGVAAGDCCSPLCAFDPINTPCPDAEPCDGIERCDGAGSCGAGSPPDCEDGSPCTADACVDPTGCVHTPARLSDCRAAGKSSLTLRNLDPSRRDSLRWKWLKGASTTQAEFAIPTGTAAYTLCLFGGPGDDLITELQVPASFSKWSPLGSSGSRYSDSSAMADGVSKLLLKGSSRDRSTIMLKAKGDALPEPDPAQPPLDLPVTAQLASTQSGVCWEASYDTTDVQLNTDGGVFKAKAE